LDNKINRVFFKFISDCQSRW